jgi:hypothetical protein
MTFAGIIDRYARASAEFEAAVPHGPAHSGVHWSDDG